MVEYRHSARAIWDIKYHLVWITKYRYKVLRGEVVERTRDLIRQICQAREVVIIRGAVSPDHIHLLVSAPSQIPPPKLVQQVKGRSSRRLQEEFPHLRKRYWASTCGHAANSARPWARSMRKRSKPTSRIKSGTKTTRVSASPRLRSLEPALSRSALQAASAAPPTFSRSPNPPPLGGGI